MKQRYRKALVIFFMLLAGCAAGPDFHRPDAPATHSYTAGSPATVTVEAPRDDAEAQHFDPARDVPFDWWTQFRSPALNQLVEQAFRANPDIASAEAALRQAQEYATAQHGFFYPVISAGYSATRSKIAGNLSGASSPGAQGNGDVLQGAAAQPLLYNFHTAQLSVSYAPDVFGLNRRLSEAAGAEVDIQRYQREAAYISLASNVFAAAVQEATLRADIAAQEHVVALAQEQLAMLQKQQEQGYASSLDVSAQHAALAQARQAVIPLRLQLAQTRDLMHTLAGRYPDEELDETFTLESLQLPQELPLSLPSKLVEQRPDILAAEAQLHYASASYGVAIANRLPQFDISAAVGGAADSPGWMFRRGGSFFDLAANVSEVIFDGGTLRAKSRAAQEVLNQAAAQYRSTVIHAVQNVADTLLALQADDSFLQASAETVDAANHTLAITRKQYETGYVAYSSLLLAEQSSEMAQLSLIQARANRLGDTAALYQSLGGGWWNHHDNAAR